MRIYDIDRAILDCIDEEGEIINFEAFEALLLERDQKVDGMACWYKQTVAEGDAMEAEAQRLLGRSKKKKKQAERIKNWISSALCGQKFETVRNKISFRRSESVNTFDEESIPKEYMRERVEYKPDKDAIKAALKAGVDVPGAALVEKNNIQIK